MAWPNLTGYAPSMFRRSAACSLPLLVLAACSSGADDARRDEAPVPLAERMAAADVEAGARLFERCAACHTIRAGGGDRGGPNLHGVMGRAIASGSDRFAYTAALRGKGGIWTAERMDEWLRDPRRFAPGNRMMFPGVPSGTDRADLIAYLQREGG